MSSFLFQDKAIDSHELKEINRLDPLTITKARESLSFALNAITIPQSDHKTLTDPTIKQIITLAGLRWAILFF